MFYILLKYSWINFAAEKGTLNILAYGTDSESNQL